MDTPIFSTQLWHRLAYRLDDPATLWQLAVLIAGAALALAVGWWLARRRIARGYAIHSSPLATAPLTLWVWLLLTGALLRRWLHIDTDILHYAVLLVGALTLIRIAVFILRHSFSPSSKLAAWENIFTLTIWSIVALHIVGWLPTVTEALDEYAVVWGKVRISALTVSSFLLSSAVLLLVALGLANILRLRLHRSENLTPSMKLAVSKLSKVILLTVAVLTAVAWAGIDLTALTIFGGALGVGLGLGLQRIVSNFVSGFVVVFEESVRPGDVISVGATSGVVQALDARYIVVRNNDGMDILIPNEELITSQIVNWSYNDRNVRVRVPIQISYNDDPERALALMRSVAAAHARVLREPAPELRLTGFGDNGIQLELGAWIADPEQGLNEVRSDLNLAIWKAFKAAGITLPSPQRQISLPDPLAKALSPTRETEGNRPK